MTAIANPIGVQHGLAYVITGPDGTRAVINDTTDADFVGFLNPDSGGGVTGLERAGVRESADVLPEADGGVHGAFRYDRLAFTLQGIIPPDSPAGADTWLGRQAKLLKATNAMRADAVLTWAPSEAPPVRVAFRQQQPTRISGRRPKTFLVAGVSEDPNAYSQALNSAILNPSLGSIGGFGSLLTSPLTSSASTIGALAVTNAGDADTWPVITFTGPCSNPVLINNNLGLGLYFIFTLAAGDSLIVDTNPRRRTVRLNGTANRYSALDWTRSVWWPLVSGANTLALGFGTFAAGATVTVQWRDAWG